LSLDYGFSYAPLRLESASFVLDLNMPSGSIAQSTDLFSPDGDGASDTAGLQIFCPSKLDRITGWSLTIFDPGNNVFCTRSGVWPAGTIVLDGIGGSGDFVEPASSYPIVVTLRDESGNNGEIRKNRATDILVRKTGDSYQVCVSSIVFKASTTDHKDEAPDLAARNLATLDPLLAKSEGHSSSPLPGARQVDQGGLHWARDSQRGAFDRRRALANILSCPIATMPIAGQALALATAMAGLADGVLQGP